ncbi:aldo/keto reductase [Jeotgalibaca arthritidis]|uniref:Aldo/keto reductase n=1 Tax=Jeotgalibaca arthritidis TaxID=1868794 RepID=A0A6G7KCY9_9LACT|nr:aldo/keto reductase [Jeotgalibaca arthritidis]
MSSSFCIYIETARRLIVRRVAEVAESLGVKRSQIALAWLLQNEQVVAPIIGATKESHYL